MCMTVRSRCMWRAPRTSMARDINTTPMPAGATYDHAKHQHDGKTSPELCCAMMCIAAIAADPPAVATPVRPISFCVSADLPAPAG